MTEDEFSQWIGSALGAMHGLAYSISVVGHTAHLRKLSPVYGRIVGACARDTVTIIDTLTRDRYRHGGVDGVSSLTINDVRKQRGTWLDRHFRPIAPDLIAIRAKRPNAILAAIETFRREATAHLPIITRDQSSPSSITAEDMWNAYHWLREMFGVWLSRLSTPFVWHDEAVISDEVHVALSRPIIG